MTITGQYINIENGSFDIFIIFPEWWDELEVDEVADIETIVEECSKELNNFSGLYITASDVRDFLKEVFHDEEYQIIVFDQYTGRGVI